VTAESPDFEPLARPLIEKLSDTMDPDNAREMVLEQLRQVWNARGAADGQALTAELQRALNAAVVQARIEIDLEQLLKALDR
jgi:hypothetical protein